MQVQNSIPNTSAGVTPPAGPSPASIVSNLPSEALYSPSFAPLYATASQPQDSTVPSQPVPFALSATQSQSVANEGEFVSTLDTASQGLGGLLNSLDTTGTNDQVNQLLEDAQTAANNGDTLTAQKKLAQAQLLASTMSTIMNLIASLAQEAIRNAKVS